MLHVKTLFYCNNLRSTYNIVTQYMYLCIFLCIFEIKLLPTNKRLIKIVRILIHAQVPLKMSVQNTV